MLLLQLSQNQLKIFRLNAPLPVLPEFHHNGVEQNSKFSSKFPIFFLLHAQTAHFPLTYVLDFPTLCLAFRQPFIRKPSVQSPEIFRALSFVPLLSKYDAGSPE